MWLLVVVINNTLEKLLHPIVIGHMNTFANVNLLRYIHIKEIVINV